MSGPLDVIGGATGGVVSGPTAPASPGSGTLWYNTTAGGLQMWDGIAWIALSSGSGGATVSNTAPSSPTNGMLWFDPLLNKMQVYYNGVWIATGGGSGGGVSVTVATVAPASPASGALWYDTSVPAIPALKLWNGTSWFTVGDVVGPATATDNAIARFDGATGNIIQNSVAILDDSGNLSGIVNLTTTGNTTLGDAATDQVRMNGVVQGRAAHNVQASTGVMDLSVAQMFHHAVTAATTWSFTNVPAASGCTVVLELTNGGAFTQTWPASVKWPLGVAPVLTPAGIDVLVFVTRDGGTTWRGNMFAKDTK